MASTLWNLGRHTEALKLQREVLEARSAKLGADHLDTIKAKGNLAVTLCDLGRHTEALKLRREVLEARSAKLGADHLATITAKGNLAGTLRNLGRHTEALKLDREVLEKTEFVDVSTAPAKMEITNEEPPAPAPAKVETKEEETPPVYKWSGPQKRSVYPVPRIRWRRDVKGLWKEFDNLSPETKRDLATMVSQVLKHKGAWKKRADWWKAYTTATTSLSLKKFLQTWLGYSPVPAVDVETIPFSPIPIAALPIKGMPCGIPDGPGYFIEKWDWLANEKAGITMCAEREDFKIWIRKYFELYGDFICSKQSWPPVESIWMNYKPDAATAKVHPFNLEEYTIPTGGFTTFDGFFMRYTKPGRRVVSRRDMNDPMAVVAPSDGNWFLLQAGEPLLYEKNDIPGKSDSLSLHDLFPGYGDRFTNGLLVDCLLWFTDFHHFMSPVSGKVIATMDYAGSYNYDFEDYAYWDPAQKPKGGDWAGWWQQLGKHRRFCWIIQTEKMGVVGMAAIGFWNVGSIIVNDKIDAKHWNGGGKAKPVCPGDTIQKGDYLGHFRYGGSSILLAFQSGHWDISAIGATPDVPVQKNCRQRIIRCAGLSPIKSGLPRTPTEGHRSLKPELYRPPVIELINKNAQISNKTGTYVVGGNNYNDDVFGKQIAFSVNTYPSLWDSYIQIHPIPSLKKTNVHGWYTLTINNIQKDCNIEWVWVSSNTGAVQNGGVPPYQPWFTKVKKRGTVPLCPESLHGEPHVMTRRSRGGSYKCTDCGRQGNGAHWSCRSHGHQNCCTPAQDDNSRKFTFTTATIVGGKLTPILYCSTHGTWMGEELATDPW